MCQSVIMTMTNLLLLLLLEPAPTSGTWIWIPEDPHVKTISFLLPPTVTSAESVSEALTEARKCSRDATCYEFDVASSGLKVKKNSVVLV